MSTLPDTVRARRLGAGLRALAVSTWLLMVFGATVRVNSAGLSCPDWPLCFGELVPRMDMRVFLEWGHRVVAGAESVGLLAVIVTVVRHGDLRRRLGAWVGVALGLLVVQIVLGGLTVLHLLADWSVTLHLVTANLYLVTLLVAADVADARPSGGAGRPLALPATLTVAVLAQLTIGGLTSSNLAGLACTEWPTCNGGVWFPTFDGIVGLHVLHRLGAYTVLALAAATAWRLRADPAAGRARMVLALVLVQIALGVSNVLAALPIELAVAHSAVADALFAASTLLTWSIARRPAVVSALALRAAEPA